MKQIIKKLAVVLSVALVCAPIGAMAVGNKLLVKNDAGTVDRMVVYDSGTAGRIGINTSIPQSGIHLVAADYPNNTIRIDGNEVSQGGGYIGYIQRTGSLPLINDRLGFFLFGTQNGATALNAAGVTAAAEANWTATSTPSYFTFATTPSGSATRTERLRINSAGNIGINTNAPTQKLEINGGLRLNPSTAVKPSCTSTSAARGTFWYTNATGADTLEVCTKDGAGNYSWRVIF